MGAEVSGAPGERVSRSLDTLCCVMRVWIDQDLCTGDGLCVDHCPDVFVQLEDGIAYVTQGGGVLNDPGGSSSLAWVPERLYQSVVDAGEACPGECIFIEMPLAQLPTTQLPAAQVATAWPTTESAACGSDAA